jgi:RimJ/RimL family protein N-acetyltransferase
VVTLLDYLFTNMGLKRVYLHTLDWNHRARRCFSKCGFSPVKPVRRMGHDFILMEVWRDAWTEKAEERLAARWTCLYEKGGEAVSEDPAAEVNQRPAPTRQA